MRKIFHILVTKMLVLILLLTQSIGLSQSIQSKYVIDNTHKMVSVPFTDVYIWSNYFVRYEYLTNSNQELNQYLTKQFQIDSTNKINHNLIYNNFLRIQKQDSSQREILFRKIADRDERIDTLKKIISDQTNKQFVTDNVIIPKEKEKSFNQGKNKGFVKGGLLGTGFGVILTITLIILL